MDKKRAGAITTAGLVTVIGLGAFMLNEPAPAPASETVPVGQIVVVTTTPGSPVADPPAGQALTEPATDPVPTLETDAPHQQATAPAHQVAVVPPVRAADEPVLTTSAPAGSLQQSEPQPGDPPRPADPTPTNTYAPRCLSPADPTPGCVP